MGWVFVDNLCRYFDDVIVNNRRAVVVAPVPLRRVRRSKKKVNYLLEMIMPEGHSRVLDSLGVFSFSRVENKLRTL